MDFKQVKALMKDFDESNLSKLAIKQGDFEMKVEKATAQSVAPAAPQMAAPQVAAPQSVSAPQESATEPKEEAGDHILSPMVGTYYAAPSPDSPDFVKVGDTIQKGQVVAILEAMKIMNEIEAEFPCKIVKILVENGQPVEFGMPLYLVEKI